MIDVLSSLLASLDDEPSEFEELSDLSLDVLVSPCDLSSVKDVPLSDDEGLEVFVSLDDDVLASLDVELSEFEELSDLSPVGFSLDLSSVKDVPLSDDEGLEVLASLDDEGFEVLASLDDDVLASLDVELCDLSSVKDVPSLDVDEFVELSTTSIGLEVS